MSVFFERPLYIRDSALKTFVLMIRKITVQFFHGAVDIISYAKINKETTKTAIERAYNQD